MTRCAILVIALLPTAIRPLDARAQTNDANQFKQFIASDFHKGLVTRAIAGISPAVFPRCPTLVSNGSQVTVLRPVTFAADGFPNAGLWKEAFPVSGCGNDTTLNLYFSAGSDEKVQTVVALPGATRADLVLQKDGYTYATVGATVAAKDCKTFYVKDTKFEGFGLINPPLADPGPGERLRPWHETWTLVGCGRTFAVPLSFRPDTTGTQIIQPGGTVER
jgi:hypothetical protein